MVSTICCRMDSPAEWTRIQAECARIAAEWTRKLAESINSVAEWTRKFAEWTRKWPNGLARFIKKVRRMDSRSVFFQNVFFTTAENESESIQRRRMDSFRKMWAPPPLRRSRGHGTAAAESGLRKNRPFWRFLQFSAVFIRFPLFLMFVADFWTF